MFNWISVQRPFIFRIVHINNLLFILQNGLHCRNCSPQDPNFYGIGNDDIIGKRDAKVVPLAPGGALSDYVPFYFSPRSPMLFSIKKNRVAEQNDIVYLVSEYDVISNAGLDFVYTDGQAMMSFSQYFNRKKDLVELDWDLFKSKFWNDTDDDNDRMRRRNSEFLVHQVVPMTCIISIVVKTELRKEQVESFLKQISLKLRVVVNQDWYY